MKNNAIAGPWAPTFLVLLSCTTLILLWNSGISLIGGIVAALFFIITAILLSVQSSTNNATLQTLCRQMASYAAGDFSARMDSKQLGGCGMVRSIAEAASASHNKLLDELGFARGVLMGMATPCVVVDTDQVLRFTNKNLLRILEQDGIPTDYYGQNVAYFFYGDASRPTVLGTAMNEKREITREVELTGRKGGKRNIRIDASPLFDLTGKLMGSLCVYADLTELRVQEASLLETNSRVAEGSARADGISGQVAQAAHELSDIVSASHTGAEQQNSRMSETLAAMAEMNGTVLEVARNAAQAAETSAQARKQAEDGAGVVGKVVDGIAQVQREALALKNDMSALGSQADAIGRIMNVISDIADQTNLLALNAAIEAARAGEAGRGFAVVADEVRKLAEKTMSATKEVGEAISGIQQGTSSSIASVDRAVRRIDEATALAGQSGHSLQQIVRLVETASDQVRSIATASEEQSAASEEINRSIEEVSTISRATAQDMTQAARAVDDLADRARVLREIIQSLQGEAALEEGRHRAIS